MTNPYSAEHPVHPTRFAGRAKQIDDFNKLLKSTIQGNSKNAAILGKWGIGKTSLLWKFKTQAEDMGCISTIVELDPSYSTYTAILETITQSLADSAKHVIRIPSVKELLERLSISVNYGPITFTPKEKQKPNILAFKKDVSDIYKRTEMPLLIMLDNAEELLKVEGALFSLRNIFQTLQSMDRIRCMLILAGDETLFTDIRSVSEPVTRFFWDVRLGPFSYDETRDAILKPLADMGITVDENVTVDIHKKSDGHPYFVQAFAYNLFEYRSENKRITIKDMRNSYKHTLKFLGFRLFDTIFQRLSPLEKDIVTVFATSKKEMLSNKDISRSVKSPSVNKYLILLSEEKPAVLNKSERGKYSLFHPLFKAYLLEKIEGR